MMLFKKILDELIITEDHYVIATLNSSVQIDDLQYSVVSSDVGLFNCMRDRSNENSLIYDVKGYIPLKQCISNNAFDFIHIKSLLINLTSKIIELNKNVNLANCLLIKEYIFINLHNEEVKFICLPVKSNKTEIESINTYRQLLKEIMYTASIRDAYELIGFVLSSVAEENFDINKFYKDLLGFKSRHSPGKTVGPFSKLLSALTGKGKKTIQAQLSTNPKLETKQIKKQQDIITPSSELNLTNIPTSARTVSFGNREFNPTDSSLKQLAQDNPTSILGVNTKEHDVPENHTQLLFNPSFATSYLIKSGNTNLVDRIFIDSPEFFIGRDRDKVNFPIPEPSVSKRHAVIKIINNEFFISDKGSSNGTFLNGIKLQQNKDYKLNHNDKVKFANQEFEFVTE